MQESNSYVISHPKNLKPLALLLMFSTILLIYLLGQNGSFYYDDIRPLSGLTKVTDFDSAVLYIFSESSGPLGRSISMLTFLFNVNDWPSANSPGNPSAFFVFNIVLHLINGLLVFSLSYFIIKLRSSKSKSCFWLAFTVAAFWLVLPIHVSTSLIAIQRMAGLSAFFVYFGLFIYVYGLYQQKCQSEIQAGLRLQLTGLFLFTLLAMFSKENGVLLPIFILVLECTIFLNIKGIDNRRKLRIFSCSAGLILILVYLIYRAIDIGNVIPGRDFTLLERLMTEPQILFEYLRLAFLPNIAAFNPFHDNYSHVSSIFDSVWVMLSISSLCILFIAAILSHKNRPLFSFAILWFLTAHLLESSSVALELYFQHRNYVALFGPCFALVLALNKFTPQYKKIVIISAITYWSILAVNLTLTTQLWGDKHNAAHLWYTEQPGSQRASDFFSYIALNENKPIKAMRIMEQQLIFCPSCIQAQAQAMLFSCLNNQQKQAQHHYQQLLQLSKSAVNTNGVPNILRKTFQQVQKKRCKGINSDDLKHLNTMLLNLLESPFNKKLGYLQNLYNIALSEKNRAEAIHLLSLAWQEQQDFLIANELVSLLLAEQKYSEANHFINTEICQLMPFNPIFAAEKLKHCNKLQKRILLHEINNKP